MNVTVTARHCDISSELRTRTETVIGRLGHFTSRLIEATVVYDVAPDGDRAEVRLHLSESQVLVGTATAGDHRTALDRAEEKIRKQVERVATQALKDRRESRAS